MKSNKTMQRRAGFRARMKSSDGRDIINRRRRSGRQQLARVKNY